MQNLKDGTSMLDVQPGDVVTYTEYSTAPVTGRRIVTQRYEHMLVDAVIPPREALTCEQMDRYYGGADTDDDAPALTIEQYAALTKSGATRLMLKDDEGHFYPVNICNDYLRTGAQKIERGEHIPQMAEEAPSYLQFLHALGGAS